MSIGKDLRNCLVPTSGRFAAQLLLLISAFSLSAGLMVLTADQSAAADQLFSFADVIEKAEQLAHKPYQPPEPIPKRLSDLTFDQWKNIAFRSNKSPWPQNNNFNVRFYHLGYLYTQPVKINIINAQGVHGLSFSPELFSYGQEKLAQAVPVDLGFAGFSLFYPLNHRKGHDEILAFIGASYFRGVGENQWFGLSARGVAINTASPSGEQFPYFKEFWLARPAASADSIKIFALLDGESVTGAYRFGVYPGDQTIMDVESVVFLRKKVERLGIAPFSSMFLQGSNSPRHYTTLAPQVHDSDGLSIQAHDNSWIWRPLQNPKRLALYSFELNDPGGFGLMQRDRRFCSYESLSLHYQDRPSAWVTADGKWGKGSLQLIELPTDTENNDNIVAFWVLDQSPEPLKPVRFSYTIAWQGNRMTLPKIGYVVNTRTGPGNIEKGTQEFDIDFTGGDLATLTSDTVSAVVSVGNGAKLLEQHVVKNDFVRGWRLEFQIRPAEQPVQLRAYLHKGNRALTETWDYVFHPDQVR
jgi:periplasmic glucans biosynthesis protein